MSRYTTSNNIDVVELCSDERFGNKKIDFPTAVLKSFDLNCVGAGIYYSDGEFILERLPEFDNFIKDNTVRVINVHSLVTIFRAVKKADDLNSKIDVELETDIIWHSTNTTDFKPLTEEQTQKHEKYITPLKNVVDKLLGGTPDDDLFSGWLYGALQFSRREKVYLLRKRLEEKNKNVIRLFEMQEQELLYVYTLSGLSFEEWFIIGRTWRDLEKFNSWLGYKNIHELFRGKTLAECFELHNYFKKLEAQHGENSGYMLYRHLCKNRPELLSTFVENIGMMDEIMKTAISNFNNNFQFIKEDDILFY
jgi:hypothetical protein